MFSIRLEGKAPIYEQLYNGILRLITAGELAPDEKLPPVREVAKAYGINPNTVQKAYGALEQAGLIYSMPAKGSYVSHEGSACEALRRDALTRAERELFQAFRAGVSLEEIQNAASRIWGAAVQGGIEE